MQTLIHVYGKGDITSLRKQIGEDKKLESYGLSVVINKKKNRSAGWSKIKGNGEYGVINIKWDASTKSLIARVVNKGGTKPDWISGFFISYLLGRHSKKIKLINVLAVD